MSSRRTRRARMGCPISGEIRVRAHAPARISRRGIIIAPSLVGRAWHRVPVLTLHIVSETCAHLSFVWSSAHGYRIIINSSQCPASSSRARLGRRTAAGLRRTHSPRHLSLKPEAETLPARTYDRRGCPPRSSVRGRGKLSSDSPSTTLLALWGAARRARWRRVTRRVVTSPTGTRRQVAPVKDAHLDLAFSPCIGFNG